MQDEKRKRTRVPLSFNAVITAVGDEIPVTTWNLSMQGMQCSCDPRLRPGTECTVVLALSRDTVLRIGATVVRVSGSRAGLCFSEIDENSFYHLRKLVQYNAEDPDTIDSELKTPSGSRH